jgi:hypothetical protein
VWEKFAKKNVDVLCLPPHTTPILQPLDQYVNAFFKKLLRKEKIPLPVLGCISDVQSFFDYLYHACHVAQDPIVIKASFRDTGIVPFNPAIVLIRIPANAPAIPSPIHQKRRISAKQRKSLLTVLKIDRPQNKHIVLPKDLATESI